MILSGRLKTIEELNILYNYDLHTLRPKNTESVEPDLKNVGDKPQDNNELIIHNTIINARWFVFWYDSGNPSPLSVKLENVTWMDFNSLPFLEEIISPYLLKRVADDMGG